VNQPEISSSILCASPLLPCCYSRAKLIAARSSHDFVLWRRRLITNGASLFIKKINGLATGAFLETAKIPGNPVEG